MKSLLLAALLASPAALAEEAAAPAPAEVLAPSPAQEALYRALSIRDPAPSCAALSELSADVVGDLSWVVAHATQPPWVGMRAAGCLLREHPEEAAPLVRSWMTGEDTKGFSILVATQLDTLPEALALELATVGLQGPHAASLRSRVARSTRPALRQLAED